MGNKIVPDNVDRKRLTTGELTPYGSETTWVRIEKINKKLSKKSSKKRATQKTIPPVLNDEDGYGYYVEISETYEDESGIHFQIEPIGGSRRNAIHPYMLNVAESQYQVQQQQHNVYTLSEQ